MGLLRELAELWRFHFRIPPEQRTLVIYSEHESYYAYFEGLIEVGYLAVDLTSSTWTCLQHLYPKIVPGGVLMSQDGDFPLVIDVFDDDFWKNVVGYEMSPSCKDFDKTKCFRS